MPTSPAFNHLAYISTFSESLQSFASVRTRSASSFDKPSVNASETNNSGPAIAEGISSSKLNPFLSIHSFTFMFSCIIVVDNPGIEPGSSV